jgi:glycosyltransferase involved in cell wall biosynthesis
MQIAILLGTLNGATYLPDQLNSYINQSHRNWTLWASDDGSSDTTPALVKTFAKQVGESRFHLVAGPQKGFAVNFLNLVCTPDLKADAYAYSDQDDIWMVDKLERAAVFLSSIPVGIPALYCSRTLYVDFQNQPIGLSQPYMRPAIFQNAMVQNIASGNTMVFNEAARSLLVRAGPNVNIDLHDWWTYMLVTGAGGNVFFDQDPTVRYRQHNGNLVGMNTSLRSKISRIKMLFSGRFSDWNERHVASLLVVDHLLTNQNKVTFRKFSQSRKSKLVSRLLGLKKSGVYRQTILDSVGFWIAAIVGKV